jgi:integrase
MAWRTIELDPATVDALREHCAAQEFERNGWGDLYRDHDLVFCNPDGTSYDPDVARRRFERRARDAGLVVLKLREARHTHATLLLENGESLKYVAARLGDREDTVLEIYQHVTAKTRAEAPARAGGANRRGQQAVRRVGD